MFLCSRQCRNIRFRQLYASQVIITSVIWNCNILYFKDSGFCILVYQVVHIVGIPGKLFETPPRLLEHHTIEPWGFWDSLWEHHPNFWNTTPSSRGASWTTFLEHHPNTTPSAQQREHQPARVGGSGATFWNTTPSSRMAINRTARNTIYGEGSGATFLNTTPSSRRAQTARVGPMRADQP